MTRRLAIWIVLLIILGVLVATAAAGSGAAGASAATSLTRDGVNYDGTVVQDGDGGDAPRIAMIPVTNAIVDGDSAPSGASTGADDLVRMIDAVAEHEDDWDGLILELDTPGGSVTAATEIHDAIKRLQRTTDMPVLAWMRGTAASAGYYIAAPTDEIVAAPTTFTGSIGVILEYYVAAGLADKVGVKPVVIKSGRLKDIGNPLRDVTPEERKVFQAAIDEAFDGFVSVVADGRKMPEETVRRLADGRFYTGKQAKDNGLVDTLGLRRDAYSSMAKLLDDGSGDDLRVVEFSRRYSLLQSLTATAQPAIGALATARAIDGALNGSVLGGSGGAAAMPSARAVDASVARLEYRAVIG